MEQKRILIVDDESDLCEILSYNLSSAGYLVETACSAEEALQKDLSAFHLLLLDVMMPGMSGFELSKTIKEQPLTKNIPIIFLTAKDTEDDTLHGFALGADDYITKPFSIREVQARVHAVLSRTQPQTLNVLTYKGLTVNADKKAVSVDGKKVSLTRTEFELLWLLLSHQGVVFSRQQLIEMVWPENVVVTGRAVDVSITRMRKKIGPYSSCVIARMGYGYYFCV